MINTMITPITMIPSVEPERETAWGVAVGVRLAT